MENYLLENSESISKREVFERVLLSEDVVNNFLNLNFLEIEEFLGKDVANMVGFKQNNPHHCYDLFEHTLRVVEGINTEGLFLEDIIKLKVAAFFHDIGKPIVAMVKGDKTVFYNHAKESAKIAKDILIELDHNEDEIKRILFYIEHHDDFINFKRENEYWNRQNKFLKGINLKNVAQKLKESKNDSLIKYNFNPTEQDFDLLLRLCIADVSAQRETVWEYGKITDSKLNKVSRLTEVKNLIPDAYKLS